MPYHIETEEEEHERIKRNRETEEERREKEELLRELEAPIQFRGLVLKQWLEKKAGHVLSKKQHKLKSARARAEVKKMKSDLIAFQIVQALWFRYGIRNQTFNDEQINEEINILAGRDHRTLDKYKRLLFELEYIEHTQNGQWQIKDEPHKPLTPSEYLERLRRQAQQQA